MAKFLGFRKLLNIGRSATPTDEPPAGLTRRAALGAAALGVTVYPQDPCSGSVGSSVLAFQQPRQGAVARPMLDKLRETVSVKDFGAVGNGDTDDTAAIQAAFDSGAAKVVFPQGRYVTGPLTLPDWLHIEGEAYQPTIGGDGRAVELRFNLNHGSGLTCGANPIIRNLFIQNIGGSYNERTKELSATTAKAIELKENAVIEDCCFSLWRECIRTGESTYYLKTSRLHFNRCVYGYRAVGSTPYNIHIDAPHSTFTDFFISGAGTHYPRNIKVFGGSIEGYAAVAQRFLDISFFGTYFETDAPQVDVIAIDPGLNEASVALFGCLIYMNKTSRFVSMSGLSAAMLTSVGNTFDGVGESGGTCLYLPASGNVTLAGDRFGRKHPASCLYVDSIASAANFNVSLPDLPSSNAQAAYSRAQLVGPRGFAMKPLAVEPDTKAFAMTVLADGKTWNPLQRASGRPYWILWQGDRWASLSG